MRVRPDNLVKDYTRTTGTNTVSDFVRRIKIIADSESPVWDDVRKSFYTIPCNRGDVSDNPYTIKKSE